MLPSSSSVAGSSNSNPRFNLMEEQEMLITSTTTPVDNGNENGDLKKKKNVNKDRKIRTAQGLRDRRVRLSIGIARKFFDLQDTLGFDKASQTLDWLFTKSKLSEASQDDDDDEHATATTSSTNNGSGIQDAAEIKNNRRKESRERARERARSRTRAKQDQQMLFHYMSSNTSSSSLILPPQNSVSDNIATTTNSFDANYHNNYATGWSSSNRLWQTQMGE